jgi:hypothetical protein
VKDSKSTSFGFDPDLLFLYYVWEINLVMGMKKSIFKQQGNKTTFY